MSEDDCAPTRIVLSDGASVAIRTEQLAVVVEVSGLADATLAVTLARELSVLEPDDRVVVDLSDAVLVGPAALCDLIDEVVAAGEDPDRICLVCERLSTQVLLRRYGATEQAAVFGTVNDALQALVMKAEGYGGGWAPGPAQLPH
jgi:anti-anti-sigma regulatory factor